ncbi:MAG TPA: glycosyltransferase [Nitrospirae bacterium]|nr:glycosyltransferase [Nitrospirota bacterium]HDZ61781.1 glycosyltransferase [Nitrospirota bacterium]
MLCSVVVPVFNEEENLKELYGRLKDVLEGMNRQYEVIFVDDGSEDKSLEIIKMLASSDKAVKYRALTRNFGHEASSTAGLDIAKGDVVVLMDADLQDPPELIPQMLKLWQEGNQLVYARRLRRYGENIFRRVSAKFFYRLIALISDSEIPVDTGDFRLMDRAVVNDFLKCREQNRFVRGLTSWVGYKQAALNFERDRRFAGESKYNTFKLLLLMLDVITGFSIKPLRVATALGFLVTVLSMVMVCVIVIQKFFFNLNIQGYALLVTGLFFMGGVQMFFLGIIGEYIGKIYRQVQGRPLYLVKEESF